MFESHSQLVKKTTLFITNISFNPSQGSSWWGSRLVTAPDLSQHTGRRTNLQSLWWGKPEYPEKTHASTGEHANSNQKGVLIPLRQECLPLRHHADPSDILLNIFSSLFSHNEHEHMTKGKWLKLDALIFFFSVFVFLLVFWSASQFHSTSCYCWCCIAVVF